MTRYQPRARMPPSPPADPCSCSAGINHSVWNGCHANIYGVATVSLNRARSPETGATVAAPRRKSVARTARTRNFCQVHTLFRCADQELLASTDLFRCYATFAANGESRLRIHKRASRAWDDASHKRQSKELVRHLAYSEQE